MNNIEILPTVSLTPFAKSNLDKLNFGSEKIELEINPVNLEFAKPSWFGRSVLAINNSKSIPVILIKTIVTLALILSIIGIPVLFLCRNELNKRAKIDEKIDEAQQILNLKIEQINKRAELAQSLGISGFDMLPTSDMHPTLEVSGTGDRFIELLKPSDFKDSIMQGTDRLNRPFIAVKLFDKTTYKVIVQTFFEKCNDNNFFWVRGIREECPELNDALKLDDTLLREPLEIGTKSLEGLRKIIAGENSALKLYKPFFGVNGLHDVEYWKHYLSSFPKEITLRIY